MTTWSEFIERYQSVVHQTVRAGLGPGQDFEDVVQHVWMHIIKQDVLSWSTGRADYEVRNFVQLVTYRIHLNLKRGLRRERGRRRIFDTFVASGMQGFNPWGAIQEFAFYGPEARLFYLDQTSTLPRVAKGERGPSERVITLFRERPRAPIAWLAERTYGDSSPESIRKAASVCSYLASEKGGQRLLRVNRGEYEVPDGI